MENNIKITFWLNKTKKNSKNLTPIYIRVLHNYDKFFKSTGIYIQASEWDKKAMRIRGTSPEVNANNATLDALKIKVLQVINQLTDMYLYELNYQFMSSFESFLKQKYNNSTTTCYKHYQRFTRVIHQAMHKGYIEKYPFENYKIKLPKKKIQYLTQAELDRIDQCDFKVERLNIIRGIFIFSCYTGLAYAESESLTPDNITTGIDGELWLNINRRKTKKDFQVPLFPRALEILEKYKNHPSCLKRGKCLPVPSNVKFNAYLKEIADIAGIPKSKPLVTHLARKTFASTVALTNGMNNGVLSKILGHNSIKVTLDSYGTIIDELMLRSVKELIEKLSLNKIPSMNSELNDDTNAQADLIKKSRGISLN